MLKHCASYALAVLTAAIVGVIVLPNPASADGGISKQQTAASAAAGEEVRVTKRDGSSQKGRLVELTSTTVVIRRDGEDVSVPLNTVRKVERVSHAMRNGLLVGAGISAALWISVAATRDTCADCEDGPLGAAFFTGFALGGGVGTGAIVKLAGARGRVLYEAPGSTPAVMLLPAFAPRRAGVVLVLRWRFSR